MTWTCGGSGEMGERRERERERKTLEEIRLFICIPQQMNKQCNA